MSNENQLKKPEVMSPAGYWPQLRVAIEAGADAVCFGLNHFTARAKVGFALAELPEVMRTLHQRGGQPASQAAHTPGPASARPMSCVLAPARRRFQRY